MGLPLFLFWVAVVVLGHLASRGRAESQVQCSSTPPRCLDLRYHQADPTSSWWVLGDGMCSLSWDSNRALCCWDWRGPLSRRLPLSVVLTPSASLSLRNAGRSHPRLLNGSEVSVYTLICLPRVSDAHYNLRTTTLESLLRLAFLKPCPIGHECPGIPWWFGVFSGKIKCI